MIHLIEDLRENREEKLDKFMFYACVIDCFFLPYFWLISVPYSMPLLFIWVICKHQRLAKDQELKKEYGLFLVLFCTMLLSTIFSFVLNPAYIYKNIVYLVQFTSMFLYYFLFRYTLDRYEICIKNILLLFVVFAVILAFFFNMDKGFYHSLVTFWNNRSALTINENVYQGYEGYRYSFIWMDANNIGYMVDAVLIFLFCNENLVFFLKTFSLVSVLYILVSCMSNGAFLSFFIVAGAYIIVRLYYLLMGKWQIKYKITVFNLILFAFACILIYLLIPQIPLYLNSGTASESLERISNNSGDARIQIWTSIINHVNFLEYIFLGKGGVTVIDGIILSPHNGHLYWILGYGVISYLIFMYLIFRKRKVTGLRQYIWIIPVFIGFTINVLLGEIKMMGMIMLLIACSASPMYLHTQRGHIERRDAYGKS